MEHRRRRPQGIQPVEAEQQEIVQENTVAAAPAHEAHMQEPGNAPHRRRRQQHAEPQQEPSAPVPADTPKKPTAPDEGLERKFPQLPRAQVETVEDDRPAVQKPKRFAQEDAKKQRAKQTYQSKISHKKLKSAANRAGKTAATAGKAAVSGGKSVLVWIGGALILLGMALGAGINKVRELIGGRSDTRKSRVSEDGHAPQAQDAFVLEAIRPEDYHGKAQSRSTRIQQDSVHPSTGKVKKKPDGGGHSAGNKGLRMPDARQMLSLVFAGVAVVSACMIVSILWRTVRTNRTNKQLAELYAQAPDAAPETTPGMIVFMPEETPNPEEGAADADVQESGDARPASDTQALTEAQTQMPEATATPVPEATVAPMGKRTYHQVGGNALPQMETLYNENRDTVGWLQIDNVLDLPVVYRDNSYYLTRDFYKQKNTAGTIFLDVNHPFKEKTQNLLLHGHNMKDGTMFGRLIQYETDLNYVRWHPFVRFDTLWRKEEYVIFAVLRVSLDVKSEEFFNYFSHPTFASDAAFESYIRQLQLRSLYAIPIDVKPTDALLTLSTCLDEDRLVIVARRVRDGETHTELRAVTNLATRQ